MATVEIVACLEDNYMGVIWAPDRSRFWLVDPGDPDVLEKYLELSLPARCAGVFVTHHHWDHVEGLAALSAHDATSVWGPHDSRLSGRVTHPLSEGSCVDLGSGLQMRALSTPGHTVPALSYVLEGAEKRYLFSGDTLFGAGCGRRLEGSSEEFWTSLEKLRALPSQPDDDTSIIYGHEYTERHLGFVAKLGWRVSEVLSEASQVQTLQRKGLPSVPRWLSREMRINPFLNADAEDLRHALGLTGDTPAWKVFETLRELRNRHTS